MSTRTKTGLIAFVAGACFAVGLAMAGMTQPANVIAFLDVTGDWNPTLLFVMGSAVVVNGLAFRLVRRRSAPFFATQFALPTRRDLDARLLIGSALFGIGWGVGGYCPGPALTSLGSASTGTVVVVVAMLAGMWLVAQAERIVAKRQDQPADEPVAAERADAERALEG